MVARTLSWPWVFLLFGQACGNSTTVRDCDAPTCTDGTFENHGQDCRTLRDCEGQPCYFDHPGLIDHNGALAGEQCCQYCDWSSNGVNPAHQAAFILSLALGLPLVVIAFFTAHRRHRSRHRAKVAVEATVDQKSKVLHSLRQASFSGAQVRLRVTGTLLYLAWVFIAIGMHTFVLELGFRGTPNETSPYADLHTGYASCICIACVLCLSAVMPKDTRIIRYALCPFFTIVGISMGGFLIPTYARRWATDFNPAEYRPYYPDARELHNSLRGVANVLVGVASVLLGALAALAFVRQFPPRRTLNGLFLGFRCLFIAMALGYGGNGIFCFIYADPPYEHLAEDSFENQRQNLMRVFAGTNDLILAGAAFVSMVLTLPSVRHTLHRQLASLNLKAEAQNAAAVASLIGNRPVDDVFNIGVANLRGLKVESITYEEFSGNAAAHGAGQQLGEVELNEKTEIMTFGEVDAFLSHSWRDDADSKWQSLHEWQIRVEEERKHPATIWFECARTTDRTQTAEPKRPMKPAPHSTGARPSGHCPQANTCAVCFFLDAQ